MQFRFCCFCNGPLAELESSLIGERVAAGMQSARTPRKHLGRPAIPQRVVGEIEALATSTNLSIRQIQSKIDGRTSRGSPWKSPSARAPLSRRPSDNFLHVSSGYPKHCKNPMTIAAFLRKNGVKEKPAHQLASSGKGWWRLASSPQAKWAMPNAMVRGGRAREHGSPPRCAEPSRKPAWYDDRMPGGVRGDAARRLPTRSGLVWRLHAKSIPAGRPSRRVNLSAGWYNAGHSASAHATECDGQSGSHNPILS
jgi:hypothetical protein